MASHLLDTADGAQLEVLVDGRAGDPGLVLLPSSQRDSLDFDELVQRLVGHGFRVLRPQPRGMGRSSPPPPDFTLHTLAADVAQAIEAVVAGPALVAGHAFGHFIARVTDLDHPARVRGVIVLAGAARSFPPGLSQALDIAADPTQARERRLQSLRKAFFAPGNDASVWLEGWHPQLRELYRRAAAVPAKDRWWPVTHAPILDLQGAQDPWRPPATRDELKDCLGEERVTVRTIAGASHALIPEQPAAVADAIAAWAGTLRPLSP
ncbi:alpha/beta hydrolase [Aquincola sp. S2]|uniref:Alpha/beta hydrolase n=1 Tax=Pseudaquabacterium terrae TaxID=2732868 RepID=A0ABX2ETE2_9BURK|nr:alpha/beta hydrolase [Aquabacterium terrae]NRF71974.1 alpha/beta hydrolase [Aquabacterium terrae]